MSIIALKTFSGEIPRTKAHLLPETAAQLAVDCSFINGTVTGLKAKYETAGDPSAIFRVKHVIPYTNFSPTIIYGTPFVSYMGSDVVAFKAANQYNPAFNINQFMINPITGTVSQQVVATSAVMPYSTAMPWVMSEDITTHYTRTIDLFPLRAAGNIYTGLMATAGYAKVSGELRCAISTTDYGGSSAFFSYIYIKTDSSDVSVQVPNAMAIDTDGTLVYVMTTTELVILNSSGGEVSRHAHGIGGTDIGVSYERGKISVSGAYIVYYSVLTKKLFISSINNINFRTLATLSELETASYMQIRLYNGYLYLAYTLVTGGGVPNRFIVAMYEITNLQDACNQPICVGQETTAQSIFVNESTDTIYTWERDIDAVRSPAVNDAYNRFYWSDGSQFMVSGTEVVIEEGGGRE